MNTNNNGKHDHEQADASLTAFALDQLSENESQDIRQRLASDGGLQDDVNATGRLAGLVEHANSTGLPTDIVGLEQKLDEAFAEAGAVTPDDRQVRSNPKKQKPVVSSSVSSGWTGRRLLAVAATTVLIAGGGYLLLTSDPPREVAVNHATEMKEHLSEAERAVREDAALDNQGKYDDEQGLDVKSLADASEGRPMNLPVAPNVDVPLSLDIPFTQGSFGATTPDVHLAEALEAVTDSLSVVESKLGKVGENQDSGQSRASQQNPEIANEAFMDAIQNGVQGDQHAGIRGKTGQQLPSQQEGQQSGESQAPATTQEYLSRNETQSIELPRLADVTTTPSTVVVPDGGTVTLGGIKVGREGAEQQVQFGRQFQMAANSNGSTMYAWDGIDVRKTAGADRQIMYMESQLQLAKDEHEASAGLLEETKFKFDQAYKSQRDGKEVEKLQQELQDLTQDVATQRAKVVAMTGEIFDLKSNKTSVDEIRRLVETERRNDYLAGSRCFYYSDYRDRDPNSSEQYELPPENQFQRPVGELARSTFSIDVDTASYANARRFINGRQLPPANAVRVEEFINYFSYDYAQPTDDKPFAVNMEVASCPWNESHKLLRVGLKGKEVPQDDRPASNLVFLIDVSGSMSDQNKLPLLQRSMLMLVDKLTENDKVAIVTYAGNAGLRLEPTSGDQKEKIRSVIHGLSAGGSTHGSAGIRMAYDLASEQFLEEGTNRVILATDGDLNVGVTADDELVQLITDKAELGVFLSVLGFGTGNLKDAKLEKIADNGNGQYSYIDSIREARKVLVEEMTGSLITIAKDVKIQIEFNPAEIAGYRLIGYENRALRNQDFDNDRVDAGDIGAGHTVTAIYELVPVGAEGVGTEDAGNAPLKYQQPSTASKTVDESTEDSQVDFELTEAARSGELVTLALRYKEPLADESTRIDFVVKDSNVSFDEASQDFRFAASVASYGMLLRHSRHAGTWKLTEVENAAASALGDDSNGHRAEFVDLVRQTRAIVGH